MGAEGRAIAGVALELAEESFEREYETGAGVVMPGAFAVDASGQELTRFALLSDPPDATPSDRLFAEVVSNALDYVLEEERAAVSAWAGIRIEIGWPRIVAWHQSGLTCQAMPDFQGEQLAGWHEQWAYGLSDLMPAGSMSGLIEVRTAQTNGAGLALMVRDRLRDERQLQSSA